MRIFFTLCLMGVLAAGLSGCSSTKVRESWTNPSFAGVSLGKLMVIAVGDDEARRGQFESEMAGALSSDSVNAIPRSSVASLRGKPGREKVVDYVTSEGFDHVLVTRLASIVDEEIEHVGYTEYEVYGVRGRFGRYWITDVDAIEHPAYTENKTHMFVETSLFETGEGNVVWRMRTETTNPQFVDLSEELIAAVRRQLRADGLMN